MRLSHLLYTKIVRQQGKTSTRAACSKRTGKQTREVTTAQQVQTAPELIVLLPGITSQKLRIKSEIQRLETEEQELRHTSS